MGPIIQQAIAVGWTAKQILNYLSGKVKDLSGGIENSRKSGYGDEDILKFLQGKLKAPKVKPDSTPYGRYLKSSGILTKDERKERTARGINTALQAGGTAIAAYTGYKNAGSLRQMAQNAFGFSGQARVQKTTGPAPVSPAPGGFQGKGIEIDVSPLSVETEQTQEVPPGVPTANGDIAPSVPEVTNKEDFYRNFLGKRNLGRKLFNMKKQGASRDEMVGFLKKSLPVMDQEYVRSIGFGGAEGDLDERLGEMVDSYFPDMAREITGEQPELAPDVEPVVEEGLVEEEVIEEPEKERKPIGVGSYVMTPSGDLGTVEALPGKTAKINFGGKQKIVKAEDLIESPLPEDELADIFDSFKSSYQKAEGESISNWVRSAVYDPINKALLYIDHLGTSYVVDDITEEHVKELNEETARKTSGGNFVGQWEKGTESPFGAAMTKFINTVLKDRGPGKEFSYKFDTVLYDPYGETAQASKKRKSDQKKAERAKKAEQKKLEKERAKNAKKKK